MGSNINGKLGLAQSQFETPSCHLPTLVEDLLHCTITMVACGSEHTAAINKQGVAYAWGLNSKGMLGIGKSPVSANRPYQCDKLEKIVQVSCGTKHTLFLDIYGRAFATGSNKLGRLGIGKERSVYFTPEPVCMENRLQKIAAGDSHSLFLTQREGCVFASGDNSLG